MVCVEAGYVSKPFTLSGDESFVASQSLKIIWQQPVQWCVVELDFKVFTIFLILLQVFLLRCFCSFVLALHCNFILYLVLCTCISQFTLPTSKVWTINVPMHSQCPCSHCHCLHASCIPAYCFIIMCSLVMFVLLLSVCQVHIVLHGWLLKLSQD